MPATSADEMDGHPLHFIEKKILHLAAGCEDNELHPKARFNETFREIGCDAIASAPAELVKNEGNQWRRQR